MMFVVPEYPQIADEMARGDVPILAPSDIKGADLVSSFEPVSADGIDRLRLVELVRLAAAIVVHFRWSRRLGRPGRVRPGAHRARYCGGGKLATEYVRCEYGVAVDPAEVFALGTRKNCIRAEIAARAVRRDKAGMADEGRRVAQLVSMTAHPLALLLLGGCAVLGSLVFAEFETGADRRAPAAEVLAPPSTAGTLRIHAASIEEQVAAVLARPLFSPSRRPPDMSAGNLAADLGLERLRLAGIITAPDRRLAIFADTDGKPLALAEGQSVKGWQVESITPRRVSLSAAGSIVNLRPQSASAFADPAAPPRLTFDRMLPDQQTRDDE
jgi:hypothetical protein